MDLGHGEYTSKQHYLRKRSSPSTKVVEYLTLQLASGWVNNDSLVRSFLNKYEIVIVPFVNRKSIQSQST
jgi:murein tripeptide amidase MpaA